MINIDSKEDVIKSVQIYGADAVQDCIVKDLKLYLSEMTEVMKKDSNTALSTWIVVTSSLLVDILDAISTIEQTKGTSMN